MNWLDTLKSLAPTLASALGGPMAGAAVSALGNIFGVSSATQTDIARMFADGQLTSDHLAEIRKLELDYQNQEKERGFRFAELEFRNTDSARKMQTETKSYFPATLSTIITAGFFGILCAMLLTDIKPSEPLLVMLGALGAGFASVVNFWLGSNATSARKTELLAQASLPGK